jgi:hypothetical protein
MPKFTVIEGDGDREDVYRKGWLRHWLAEFMIETLRSVARGHDEYRASGALLHALQEISEHGITGAELADLWKEEVKETASRLDYDLRDGPSPERDVSAIISGGLQVLAERRCGDSASRGRESQRMQRVLHAVEMLNYNRSTGYGRWASPEEAQVARSEADTALKRWRREQRRKGKSTEIDL